MNTPSGERAAVCQTTQGVKNYVLTGGVWVEACPFAVNTWRIARFSWQCKLPEVKNDKRI